ncbi:MAG TPA: hypothetical protein DDX05_05115 [Deltaproteobacteria bacterium]|nr:hypothetical protein [Deltaproteobacteria bacterium]
MIASAGHPREYITPGAPAGSAPSVPVHALRVGEVHAALSSRPAGLSPAEVAERLRRHGPNAPRSFRPDSSGTASCGPGSRRRWGCCS